MPQFRIVDMRDESGAEQTVDAGSPERAAFEGLKLDLTRSGARRNLVCRVYWRDPSSESLNMVRLYARSA